MDEREIIELLRQGDDRAFKTIVDKWEDMVYNTTLSIVQNELDAEDLTQDVFVQVYQSIESFKGESKFSTWLYRIAITKSLDFLRKKKRKKRFAFIESLFGENNEEQNHPIDFIHPGIKLEQKESGIAVFKAINKLPNNQKVAFVLQKLEGLSLQEISVIMNSSISSVESLLHRAKQNLRKELESIYKNRG